MSYFSPVFIKELTSKSTYKYSFSIECAVNTEEEREQFKSICVQTVQPNKDIDTLPDELVNPACLKAIFDQWILDCSNCFVKPPTFEKFKYVSELAVQHDVSDDLECSSNTLCNFYWFPVTIVLDMPVFKIHWSVMHKTPQTPTGVLDKIVFNDDSPIVQTKYPYSEQPDGTRFIKTNEGVRTEWLQEMNGSALPLSDSPALRLELDYDEAQREKFRRRVREARIRAKLARYRAERLAHRYEERFGAYPDEDMEEAQTEAEQSDEE
jgi:hypothetical protein